MKQTSSRSLCMAIVVDGVASTVAAWESDHGYEDYCTLVVSPIRQSEKVPAVTNQT